MYYLTAKIRLQKLWGISAGLPSAIPDALVRGTGLVNERTGTALDIFGEHSVSGGLFSGGNRRVVDDYVERCHKHIDIRIVPTDREKLQGISPRSITARQGIRHRHDWV